MARRGMSKIVRRLICDRSVTVGRLVDGLRKSYKILRTPKNILRAPSSEKRFRLVLHLSHESPQSRNPEALLTVPFTIVFVQHPAEIGAGSCAYRPLSPPSLRHDPATHIPINRWQPSHLHRPWVVVVGEVVRISKKYPFVLGRNFDCTHCFRLRPSCFSGNYVHVVKCMAPPIEPPFVCH